MKNLTKPATRLRRFLRNGLMGLALAGVLGGAAAAPALADEWHGGHRDQHEHVWRGHDWRGHERHVYRPYTYVAPVAPSYGYGYRYAPPSVYTTPSLSFGFVFR